MKFLRQLAKTELTALVALAIAAVVLAGFSAVQASFASNPLLGVASSAKVVFIYTMAFGCLPVALFGAPFYSTLRYFRKAGWLSALGIGLLPGLALLLVATDLALWSLFCGVFVAVVTHAVCGTGSNRSFEADGFAAAQLQRYASMNQHRRPIWFAVLVTPWAVPLAFVIWSVFAVLFTEGTAGLKDWSVLFAFFVLVLAVTYVPMLIFGLPYVMCLKALGVLTAPLVCIGAVLAAIVAIPVFGWLTGPHIPPSGASILLSGALGLLSGLVFCIAAGITFRPSGRRTGAA